MLAPKVPLISHHRCQGGIAWVRSIRLPLSWELYPITGSMEYGKSRIRQVLVYLCWIWRTGKGWYEIGQYSCHQKESQNSEYWALWLPLPYATVCIVIQSLSLVPKPCFLSHLVESQNTVQSSSGLHPPSLISPPKDASLLGDLGSISKSSMPKFDGVSKLLWNRRAY